MLLRLDPLNSRCSHHVASPAALGHVAHPDAGAAMVQDAEPGHLAVGQAITGSLHLVFVHAVSEVNLVRDGCHGVGTHL